MQNLQKKHQAMLAEIEGHEPRIKEVTQNGQDMINDGHFASDDIQNKIAGLNVSFKWLNRYDSNETCCFLFIAQFFQNSCISRVGGDDVGIL